MKKTHEDRIFPLIRCDTVKHPLAVRLSQFVTSQASWVLSNYVLFSSLRSQDFHLAQLQISWFSSGSAHSDLSSSGWLQLSRSSSSGWLQLSRSSSPGWLQLSRSSSAGWLQLSRSSSTGSVTSVGFKCHGRREASNVTLLPHSGYKISTIYLCRH